MTNGHGKSGNTLLGSICYWKFSNYLFFCIIGNEVVKFYIIKCACTIETGSYFNIYWLIRFHFYVCLYSFYSYLLLQVKLNRNEKCCFGNWLNKFKGFLYIVFYFVLKDNNPAPNLTLMLSVTLSSFYKHTIKFDVFLNYLHLLFFLLYVCVRLMTFHMNWNMNLYC